MCYQYHACADAGAMPCPMCKVFKPSAARCPHLREICSNRANHARIDVLHLKNAEVKSFNGCGYCKWARANPRQANSGWPGCCRPPTQAELRLIQPADWPTVSIVHSIPMPTEIKAVLDAILARGAVPRTQPSPSLDRRNSTTSQPRRPPPQCAPAPLARRQTYTDSTRDRSRPPSVRRQPDHDSLPRRHSASRPALPAAFQYASASQTSLGSSLEAAMAALDVSTASESSSDSGSSRGSLSDATVISDGAFTDYLSDESEAELQRQAEAKAALVAQNQAEELEFKAARQQLVGVGLRPPKAWDDTNDRAAYAHHPYHAASYAPAAARG